MFHRSGCPHCERAFEYLSDLQKRRPRLAIEALEINESPHTRERFFEINRSFSMSCAC